MVWGFLAKSAPAIIGTAVPTAGFMGLPYILDAGKRSKQDILEQGFVDPGQTSIELNPWQQWTTGWTNEQATDKVVEAARQKARSTLGPDFGEIERLVEGAKYDPREYKTAQDFVDRYRTQLRQAQREEEAKLSQTIDNAAFHSDRGKWERDLLGGGIKAQTELLKNQALQQQQQFLLQHKASELARERDFNLRRDQINKDFKLGKRGLDMQMLNLDKQDALSRYQLDLYDKHHADNIALKRKASTEALVTGLVTLGSSFFV